MLDRNLVQRSVSLIGVGATLATLAFLVWLFASTVSGADVRALIVDHWGLILVASILYLAAYLPLIFAWVVLARASGAELGGVRLARILLVSQIGKYAPGNVAQFLGRAWMARAAGVPLPVAGLAMALEVAGILVALSIVTAASVAVGLVTSPTMPKIGLFGGFFPGAAVGSGLASLFASCWIMRGHARLMKRFVRPLVLSVGLYLCMVILIVAINVMLVRELGSGLGMALAGRLVGAVLMSWMIGFVMPGSPAGLGVRELSFYGLLEGSFPDEVLLLAALAFRVSTLIGDGAAWLVGLSIGSLRPEPAAAIGGPD